MQDRDEAMSPEQSVRAKRGSAGKADAPAATASPMIRQYQAIKQDNPDSLLFFRMGDFYELFFEDAVKAAEALNITLTKRGRHDGDDIPMCGVPHHAADSYLERLIRQGFKVSVCEQMEDPAAAKKRGPKSVVRRDVVRVVTPGTLTEDTLLDARRHNYLAALGRAGNDLALAWIDISTGDFSVSPTSPADLSADLARLDPRETLVADGLLAKPEIKDALTDLAGALTPLPTGRFDSQAGERRLKALFEVAALDGFGSFARAELGAAGALVDYIELTQKGRMPLIRPPALISAGSAMALDAATRRNLELTETLSGAREGSLLHVIDRTVTGAGARRLAAHLAAPLTAVDDINRRLDMVQHFHQQDRLRDEIRAALRKTPDIERALSRLSLGRGGPRDLAAIRDGLGQAAAIRAMLDDAAPDGIRASQQHLGDHAALVDELTKALAGDLPVLVRDGGFIAERYDAALDEFIALCTQSGDLLKALRTHYRQKTGIDSLKVTSNNVLGHFIEVTPRHADAMGPDFIHRQTLISAVRYTTPELVDLQEKIESAGAKALAREIDLFERLRQSVLDAGAALGRAAAAIAALDVAASLAVLAVERGYCRPEIDDSLAFEILDGRHPVVEAAAAAMQDTPFVPNDCGLGPDNRLWLVTGPNMAGKSTFLRQNALIAMLAQMGAFVPARQARLGVVDRVFSRVGAADDLARGRSTFMVEMVETAAILNQSGERALVILDEIGRGTATFDGLSIAWATVEYLHDVNRCRALFATHYHELTALAGKLDRLSNHTMRVTEWQGDVVFLHEVGPGVASGSYGIQVARLAGLPWPVIDRAGEVLALLEKGEQSGALSRLAEDLPLFHAAKRSPVSQAPAPDNALIEALTALLPDDMAPREALEALYRLKALLPDQPDK